MRFTHACCALLCACLAACHSAPLPGPDKQGAGLLSGAAVGAGAGAMTGFQVSAGTGPGAFVGAGVGAVAGGFQGLADDMAEENMLKVAAQSRRERQRALVHETLEDHYRRRLQLHPTRDIYPADLFFMGDEVQLRDGAVALIDEIARLNKRRMPWSRLEIVAYNRSADGEKSDYARHLAQRRSRVIASQLVRAGLEPRRLEARGVIVDAPLLIDPADRADRYNQAIEIVPLDR